MENNQKKYIALEADAKDWEDALRICGSALIENECIGNGFIEACVTREKSFPTGLPTAIPVAIPHAASDEVYTTSICVLKLKNPVVFKRMDDADESVDAKLIFNLAIKGHNNHLDFLQKLIAFVMDEEKVKHCLTLAVEDIPEYLKTHIV